MEPPATKAPAAKDKKQDKKYKVKFWINYIFISSLWGFGVLGFWGLGFSLGFS